MKILIVTASQTGRTKRMAEAFAEGANEVGAEVLQRSADDVTEEEVVATDALVLGSGVHMAGIESSMRQFFERVSHLWVQGKLIGKVGAVFATAGEGGRGGGELALVSLLANLAEHGMILVSMTNRAEGFRSAGCHWGPLARTNPRDGIPGPTEEQLAAGRAHGRHVAECTARWLAGAGD